MQAISRLARSTVGAKIAMAVSGLALVGFLIGHIAGNLLIFKGPDAINGYGVWLREHGMALWALRLGSLFMLAVHVRSALALSQRNEAARPVAYANKRWLVTTQRARWMKLSGITVFVFFLFHLAHYTFGLVQPDAFHGVDAQQRHDIYAMVVAGFSNPALVGLYTVAMVLLGIHLSHGVSSFFQTMGLSHPRYDAALRASGPVFATLVVAAYLSIPYAVLLGIVGAAA